MCDKISIVPVPAESVVGENTYVLASSLDIVASEPARAAATYLGGLLERGIGASIRYIFPESPEVEIGPAPDAESSAIRRILFGPLDGAGEIGAYRLEIGPSEIRIEGAGAAGHFWATQTLRQLLPPEVEVGVGDDAFPITLPEVRVADRPRFGWRGLHFDASRHFFPVSFIKLLIDAMALHKLDRFHWHLTDDQGWRIEIKRYPELSGVGAWRRERDGSRYGGYYTQEEIREVVAYAGERQVTIVPEIEMPGHARAAIAAYPWLSCTKEALEVWNHGGISKDLFCAGREETFELLEGVLEEVADLFPGELIHIGGDECPKDRWKACPDCQARIRDEGLADEEALQGYFVRRVQAYLLRLGKRIVGWDEILDGGLAPGATVMSWRGVEGGLRAARAGHRAVMSPIGFCYFDYRQSANPGELGPTHFDPPVTTLRTVYSYEPVPEELSAEEGYNVLGAQGNVWTEDIDTPERAGYMIFPRLCALAEVLWSPAERRDWESFKRRLTDTMKRFEHLSLSYCRILESLE